MTNTPTPAPAPMTAGKLKSLRETTEGNIRSRALRGLAPGSYATDIALLDHIDALTARVSRLLEAVEGAEKALEFIARQKTSSEIWGVCLSKKDRGYRVPRDTTYLFDVVVGRARDALATLLAAREVKP